MDGDLKLIREEVSYEVEEDGTKNKVVTKIYEKTCKYYENHKKAVAEYQKNNKEAVSRKISAYQVEKYHNDPEFREKAKERRRESYRRKKELLKNNTE
jgi:hypothetical protein